jgi:hypothetical protein
MPEAKVTKFLQILPHQSGSILLSIIGFWDYEKGYAAKVSCLLKILIIRLSLARVPEAKVTKFPKFLPNSIWHYYIFS